MQVNNIVETNMSFVYLLDIRYHVQTALWPSSKLVTDLPQEVVHNALTTEAALWPTPYNPV